MRTKVDIYILMKRINDRQIYFYSEIMKLRFFADKYVILIEVYFMLVGGLGYYLIPNCQINKDQLFIIINVEQT